MASQGNEILKIVKVIFANGESSDPSTPTEPEDSAIPVPVDLTAENTVDSVKLSWSIPLEVGDVKWEYDEFVVVRELANGTGSEIGRTSRGVYSYLDKDVKDGESYTYIVCALKDGVESGGFSKTVTITYDANPFTTTTIRDTAIRIGNQEDGSTNFTGVDKLWLTTGTQGMRISAAIIRHRSRCCCLPSTRATARTGSALAWRWRMRCGSRTKCRRSPVAMSCSIL